MLKTIKDAITPSIASLPLLALLVCMFCLPGSADAAITRVQSKTGNTGANAVTSFTIAALNPAPANGNTLVAVISTRGTTSGRVSGITQSGVTWQKVTEATNASGVTTEIWYAPGVSGAGTTITVSLAASLRAAAVVIEYSGLITAGAVDVTAASTGNSSTSSTGTTATTSQANELWLGAIGTATSSTSLTAPTNSFSVVTSAVTTSTTTTNNTEIFALERVATATGTASSGGSIGTTANWAGAIATFKEVSPPIAGLVTVTPDVAGVTSSSPVISTGFTSYAPIAVSGCQYTTNGSTWTTGTVSGTLPSYTCTASPTGLSGTLTINMRATNSGGTTAATAITRTVDSTPPTATLSAFPGNTDVGLVWNASDGSGSGIDHYDLYFQQGPSAPACGSGTAIYAGKWLNFTHTGRSANTQYSYSLCATDRMGNVSTAASATVVTLTRPTAVNSCGACHGNPPVDNASRVGGTVGQFPGSHNKHSGQAAGQSGYACTYCHVNNTTFGHANGAIDIVMGQGTYSRGNTPPVANTFTPGNCSNTYCHSNGTGGTSQAGESRPVVANTSPNWGGSTNCYSCHGTSADVDGRPQYATGSPKSNDHLKTTHRNQACTVCHDSVTESAGAYITDPVKHNNGEYNIVAGMGYTYAPGGGTCSTSGCHVSAQWGVTRLGCVECHAAEITRTKGRPGQVLGNVVAEFNNNWSHKRSSNNAVTNADCIVCHLEGDSATQQSSAKHQDGNIDLRDPDGATAEAAITNVSGASGGTFVFQRFTTSYVGGSRTTTGHLADTIDNVITQKFCLKCHDANGATNPGARVGGAATSQYKPFNTTIAGTGYVTPLSAGVAGGVVDVDRQFATTNSSLHPVKGPRNKDYPTPAKLNAPYNNFTRTAGTKANGIVLNCFDCHNVVGTPLTTRTVTAHGNAVTIRGLSTMPNSGATPAAGSNEVTLCKVCHYQYDTQTQPNHGTGSASGNLDRSEKTSFMRWGCTRCHSGGYFTSPARPKRGEDVHGYNSTWTSTGYRQTAFIRNTDTLSSHRPRMIGTTSYTANCVGMFGDNICDESGSGRTETYSPGGSY